MMQLSARILVEEISLAISVSIGPVQRRSATILAIVTVAVIAIYHIQYQMIRAIALENAARTLGVRGGTHQDADCSRISHSSVFCWDVFEIDFGNRLILLRYVHCF